MAEQASTVAVAAVDVVFVYVSAAAAVRSAGVNSAQGPPLQEAVDKHVYWYMLGVETIGVAAVVAAGRAQAVALHVQACRSEEEEEPSRVKKNKTKNYILRKYGKEKQVSKWISVCFFDTWTENAF